MHHLATSLAGERIIDDPLNSRTLQWIERMIFITRNGNRFATARNLLIALTFSAVAVPALASTTAGTVTNAEANNEAVVREAFEQWAAGSGNVFDLLAPDVRWTIHGTGPVADTYNGVEDFMQRGSVPLVSRLASPLTPVVHHVWAVRDKVLIRFDASAITTSGAPYRNQFVWIFRLEDELVVEAEAFLDLVAYQEVINNNEPRPR